MEKSLPWELISMIGVHSREVYVRVMNTIRTNVHRPEVRVQSGDGITEGDGKECRYD